MLCVRSIGFMWKGLDLIILGLCGNVVRILAEVWLSCSVPLCHGCLL